MILAFDTICGVSVGIELWFGNTVDPDDVLAVQIDLFIIRITIVIKDPR